MKPKEYLRSGDIVKLCNGDLYMYIPDYFGSPAFVNGTGYIDLHSYDDNLEISIYNDYYAINCIYRTRKMGFGFSLLNKVEEDYETIWKRGATIELTMEDIAEKYGVDKVIITNYKGGK